MNKLKNVYQVCLVFKTLMLILSGVLKKKKKNSKKNIFI